MAKAKNKPKNTMPQKHKEMEENKGYVVYICAEMTGNGQEVYRIDKK